jgi:hypothetical protein
MMSKAFGRPIAMKNVSKIQQSNYPSFANQPNKSLRSMVWCLAINWGHDMYKLLGISSRTSNIPIPSRKILL